jgi:hypothetical protein
MPYCTVVEFEWDASFDWEEFAKVVGAGAAGGAGPAGRLSQISGIDDKGARMIEVWRSSDDARAFAEQSKPMLAEVRMPAPSRVFGFEVTSYTVS